MENLYKPLTFEYHQKLHHSQTVAETVVDLATFEYHQKLHHSQTVITEP